MAILNSSTLLTSVFILGRLFKNSAALVIMLLWAFLLVGCSGENVYRGYANAVGPDLYSRQTLKNTTYLATYTSSICAQSGLVSDGRCHFRNSADWTTFVQMGLYDIDQRCDLFLDTLYYKEKTNEPILAGISDASTLTRTVMSATEASSGSLQIVAAAFDFASNSFRNTRHSLLEALDPTTVKSIVFKRQKDVKREIAQHEIRSMPEALHALRAYLRVCMPFAIEMEANAALTTLQWSETPGHSPVGFEDLRTKDVPDPDARVKPGPRGTPEGVEKIKGGTTLSENEVPLRIGKEIQAMLCVATADGNFASPDTRARMGEFERGLFFANRNKLSTANSSIDDRAEFRDYKNAATTLGACNAASHLSAFEAGFFTAPKSLSSIAPILSCVLKKSSDVAVREKAAKLDLNSLKSDRLTSAQREAFRLAGIHYGLNSDGKITEEMASKIYGENCFG